MISTVVRAQERRQYPAIKNQQPSHQPSQVVTRRREDRVQGISELAFQVATPHPVFRLQMANRRLHRLTSFQPAPVARCQAFPFSLVQHARVIQLPAPVAQVHDQHLRFHTGEDAGLFPVLRQRLAIVRIAREASGSHDQSPFRGDRNANLHPKLVRLAGFALTDAFHFRRVPGVEFVFVFRRLAAQTFGFQQRRRQPFQRLQARLATDVS